MRICLSHSRLFLRAGQRENSCRPTNYFSLPVEQIFISPLTMQRYKNFIALTNKSSKKARKKARSIIFNICYSATVLQLKIQPFSLESKRKFYYYYIYKYI